MSRKPICVLATALAVLIAVPAHAINMDFFQVDWLSDPGVYVSQDSDWGRVEIGLSATDDSLFFPMVLGDGTVGRGGFINIFTDAAGPGTFDREIYNLPIFYEDPAELDWRLPQGAMFDLGVMPGMDVADFDYDFTIDPTPRPIGDPLPMLNPVPAMVAPFEILSGGDSLYVFGVLTEGAGTTTPAAAKDLEAVKDGEKIGSRASIAIPETSVAAVSEDKNGCAPGSVARSIKYMADANSNVTVPASAGTVYGDLYGDMKTNNGKNGTYTTDILAGKNKYVKDNKLPIITTQTQNFKKAMETLKNKGDVEIGIRWGTKPPPPAGGTSLGAHRAFVSEIQEITDAAGNVTGYVVKTIDDPKQGDGTAANKTHTARFDAAGNLVQYDGKATTATGAGLINFQTEDVHTSTVALEFWGGSTTYIVLQGGYIPSVIGSVPVARPGESSPLGGVRMSFNTAATNATVVPELVVNPLALPEPQEMLDVNLDIIEFAPENPNDPVSLAVVLAVEHVKPDELPGELVPVLPGEPDVFFLENIVFGGSFFDITYQVSTAADGYEDGDSYQVFRLHGEVDEELLESVWLVGVSAMSLPPNPGADHVDSFFDVFFELEIMPDAPEISTLFHLQLTAVEALDLIPGDANGDGIVNEGDAAVLAANWLKTENAYWTDGDFNNDGRVDDRDATIMAANWLATSLPLEASVPEPATIILLLAGGLCILCRRVRRDAPRN